MPLDPQARAYLDAVIALGGKLPRDMTPDEWRQSMLDRRQHFPVQQQPIAKTEDRTVPSADGDIPIRVYTPDAAGPLPILVYYHGGGWVIGSIETHDNTCRALANLTPCIVVSVEYRLALIPRGITFTDTIRIERISLGAFYEFGTVAGGVEDLVDGRFLDPALSVLNSGL